MNKRVGNMDFDVQSIREMTFPDFKKLVSGHLWGIDAIDAYKQLGGGKSRKRSKKK